MNFALLKRFRYKYLSLTDENGYKRDIFTDKLVHRMVAEEKLKKPLGNKVVHHKDLNKTNNDPSNLQLMTRSEHTKLHWKLRKNDLQKDFRRKTRKSKTTGNQRKSKTTGNQRKSKTTGNQRKSKTTGNQRKSKNTIKKR